MKVDLFDFDLPNDRIALRPVFPRHNAKLLQVEPDAPPHLEDHLFFELPGLLHRGDRLVINDTRVIPARLKGRRTSRSDTYPSIEITLHKQESAHEWQAFAKPAKKLQVGDVISFTDAEDIEILSARVLEKKEFGNLVLRLETVDRSRSTDDVLHQAGEIPLPPYIASKRATDVQDLDDYQTVYAQKEGAVAAPTAGLHFTDEVMQGLDSAGIDLSVVTLHVGAGTFLPVKADDTKDHQMHAEWGEITVQTAAELNQTREKGGRLVAVGTTSLRLLESAADENGKIHPFASDTDIFITPGFKFNGADLLITNFHLPKSTLFMLVSAFCGLEMMQQAYAHAIQNKYRFYSYGDACLLHPTGKTVV